MGDTSTTTARGLLGYDVKDHAGRKVGRVARVWVDEQSGRAAFLGVRTSWFDPRVRAVPFPPEAVVSDVMDAVRLPYTDLLIKSAPVVDGKADLSAEDEALVGLFFGVDRVPSAYLGGLPAETGAVPRWD